MKSYTLGANPSQSIASNQIYLERNRIHVLLDQSFQKPIVLVAAETGYGKTKAVSNYLSKQNAAVIWLQLFGLDNTPSRLWERFIRSLHLADNALVTELLAGGIPSEGEMHFFTGLLSREMDMSSPVYLVLDDFHLLENSQCIDFFIKLAHSQMPNLKTVFITKKERQASQSAFDAGQCALVTQKDLSFTIDEIMALFDLARSPVTRQLASDLRRITNGSILSVQLAKSVMLSPIADKDISSLNAVELIDKEVYQKAAKPLQDFMLQLSMLKNIPYDLALIIANGDYTLLDQMMKYCSFINLDCFSRDIRIHPLLLDVLLSKRQLISECAVKTLLSRAASWYEQEGFLVDAILCAQTAGEYDKAFALIKQLPFNASVHLAHFVVSVIDDMPESYKCGNSEVVLYKAVYMTNNLEYDKAERMIDQLLAQLETLPSTERTRNIMGDAYIIKAGISLLTSAIDQNYRFLDFYRLAKQYLPNGSLVYSHNNPMPFTACSFVLRICDHSGQALDLYMKSFSQAFPFMEELLHGYACGAFELMKAEKAYFQNDLANAIAYANAAIANAEKSSQKDIKELAMFYLIRIGLTMGDYQSIQKQLAQLGRDAMFYDYFNTYDIYHGWFYAMIKRPEKVADWIINEQNSDNSSPYTFAFDRLVRARYYLARQRYEDLLLLLDKKQPFTLETFFIGDIEMTLIRAIALNETGQSDEAMQLFAQACRRALPNRIIMPFIENGRHACRLAQMALHLPDNPIPADWLENILVKASVYEKRVSQVDFYCQMDHKLYTAQSLNILPLEMRVLFDMSLKMTIAEIADENDISKAQVKEVYRSLCQKMNACSTLNAVYKAMQSGIL